MGVRKSYVDIFNYRVKQWYEYSSELTLLTFDGVDDYLDTGLDGGDLTNGFSFDLNFKVSEDEEHTH